MSHALHTAVQVMIALSCLALLIGPRVIANDGDLDADNRNETHIP